MSKHDKGLTVGEASQLTGIPRRTITHNINAGTLPAADKLPGRNGAYLLDPGAVKQFALDLAREHENRARAIRAAVES